MPLLVPRHPALRCGGGIKGRLALGSGSEKDNWNWKKVCKNKSFVGKRGVTPRPVSIFLLALDEKLPYHFEFVPLPALNLP